MSDNALSLAACVIEGLVTMTAIASATILCLLDAPIGFTICSGLTALLLVIHRVI